MKELIPSFAETILNPVYEITPDIAEIGIDSLFESEVLKELPIIKTVVSICNVGLSLRERNQIKQTLRFLETFNARTIDQRKLDRYRQKLRDDPTKFEKELGRVLLILDNHIEEFQSSVVGGFFRAYIQGCITWEKFCELAEANRRMFHGDYAILYAASRDGGININDRELYQVDRLISLGLLQNSHRLGGIRFTDFDEEPENTYDIIITSFGEDFCRWIDLRDKLCLSGN